MAPKRKKPAGPRGPRGRSGAAGPPGPAGKNHTIEIALLSAQVAEVIRELQAQLTRIAQIQAQLDHLILGEPRPSVLRDPARTDN